MNKPISVTKIFREVGKLHGFVAYASTYAKPIGNDLYGVVWLQRSRFSPGYYLDIGLALRPTETPSSKTLEGSVRSRVKPTDQQLAYSKSMLEESGSKVAEPTLRRLAEWAFTFVVSSWSDEVATAEAVLREDFVDVWGCWPYVDIKAWAKGRLERRDTDTNSTVLTPKLG